VYTESPNDADAGGKAFLRFSYQSPFSIRAGDLPKALGREVLLMARLASF
jgi:hypothetical protein